MNKVTFCGGLKYHIILKLISKSPALTVTKIMKKYYLEEIRKSKKCFPHIQKDYLPYCPVHQHDYSELVIVSQGEGKHIIEDQEYYVKEGDVFVIKGNTVHTYSETKNFYVFNLCYRRQNLLEKESNLKKLPGFQTLFVLEPYFRSKHNFKSKIKLELTDFEYIKRITEMMLAEYSKEKRNYETRVHSYFRSLIVFLAQKYVINNKNKSSSKLLQLANAISYMENNYTKQINLEDLAEKASLSTRHFGRIFKQNYHTTPIKYLIQLRIKHACSLLKESSASITKIAYESGFKDSNYFSRQFKKIMGMPPSEYKQKLAGN